jgi:uncharacterized protein YdeI (YjbR/CyaY-like superfamily)
VSLGDTPAVEPTFFESPAELRRWFETNHAAAAELYIGFYKKASEKSGISYAEALDEALSFGWIDDVRKGLDENRWMIRFTPRTARSIWSAVNIKRAGELVDLGRMQPAGVKAFEGRDPARANLYSYERESASLAPQDEAAFRRNRVAWDFFEAQAASYRRAATWWVVSAKQEATRIRRLGAPIEHSQAGQRLPSLLARRRPSDRQP